MSVTVTAALVFGLVVTCAALLLVAGVAFGLWIGEVGRRKDAQRREGVIEVDEPREATVIAPGHEIPAPSPELEAGKDSFVAETMAETGCTHEEAEREWATLVSRSQGDQGGPGW